MDRIGQKINFYVKYSWFEYENFSVTPYTFATTLIKNLFNRDGISLHKFKSY